MNVSNNIISLNCFFPLALHLSKTASSHNRSLIKTEKIILLICEAMLLQGEGNLLEDFLSMRYNLQITESIQDIILVFGVLSKT